MNTVSTHSNLELIDFARDDLAGLGVRSRLTYNADKTKANLFATLGAGKPAGVIVSGHTDTVPWDGQDWSVDPLSALVQDWPQDEHDGEAMQVEPRLYGRGSADMKSFIAIALANAERFIESDSPFAVHFAFSYDEEVGCFGVRELIADMKDQGIQPLACIVGEPTHDGAGHRAQGRLPLPLLRARQGGAFLAHAALGQRDRDGGARGRQAARHGRGLRARRAALRRLRRALQHRQRRPVPRRHRRQRGAARRRVPLRVPRPAHGRRRSRCRRRCGCMRNRLEAGDEEDRARGRLQLRDHLRDPQLPDHGRRPRHAASPSAWPGESRTTLVAFGTEAGIFKKAGIPTVVCGPGSITQAHQPDEYVTLEQLARCEQFLQGLAATREIR